jgi:hypothetical protein
MYPIPLSRESLMILGWFLVFFAVAMRSGGPAGELANPMSNAHDVSVQEAIALIDAGALVIDVRERAASANSHLPGALLIPLEVLSGASLQARGREGTVDRRLLRQWQHARTPGGADPDAGWIRACREPEARNRGLARYRIAGRSGLRLLKEVHDSVKADPVQGAARLSAHHRLGPEGD